MDIVNVGDFFCTSSLSRVGMGRLPWEFILVAEHYHGNYSLRGGARALQRRDENLSGD